MAYGQQYAFEQLQNGGPARLEAIKAAALDAVRRGLDLEPDLKSLLRSVWDPNAPNKVSATENDLEVFHGDPAFQALLQ